MKATSSLIQISQSDLLDFALSSGASQQTKVSAIKNRPPYDPRTDHWKRLRDRITKMHRQDEPSTVLDDLCAIVPDKKKERYRKAVAVYKRFLRGKTLDWFTPVRWVWKHGDLAVSINPELGLYISGTPHVIKLYFREEKLTKDKAAGIIQLMETTLQAFHPAGTIFSILDVPNNKLLTNPSLKRSLMPLIRAYAIAFAQLYNEL